MPTQLERWRKRFNDIYYEIATLPLVARNDIVKIYIAFILEIILQVADKIGYYFVFRNQGKSKTSDLESVASSLASTFLDCKQ